MSLEEKLGKSLGKALELRPGGVYAIELNFTPTDEQWLAIKAATERTGDHVGCKFVFLAKGMRIAREADPVEGEHF